jgi:hypothetical protein
LTIVVKFGVTLIFNCNLSTILKKNDFVIAPFVVWSHSLGHLVTLRSFSSLNNVLFGIPLQHRLISLLVAACFASWSASSFPWCPVRALTQLNSIYQFCNTISITFILILSMRYVWVFRFLSDSSVIRLSVDTKNVLSLVFKCCMFSSAFSISSCLVWLFEHRPSNLYFFLSCYCLWIWIFQILLRFRSCFLYISFVKYCTMCAISYLLVCCFSSYFSCILLPYFAYVIRLPLTIINSLLCASYKVSKFIEFTNIWNHYGVFARSQFDSGQSPTTFLTLFFRVSLCFRNCSHSHIKWSVVPSCTRISGRLWF